ncbi:hypothetical protein HYU09_05190 [Candidatus Woesearchaeota archaeon]|nr:hypothetical protein [Candidatus Woesearchaeota archaeon]
MVSLNLRKILMYTIMLLLVFHYTIFIFRTPLDDDWPDYINFRDYQTMIDDFQQDCPRGFCYKAPFNVETEHIVDLKIERKESNVFSMNAKVLVDAEANIENKPSLFINESRVEGVPEIYLNHNPVKFSKEGGFYLIGSLFFSKDIKPNIFEIRNLVLKREIYPIDEIKVPLFFKKESYVESINLPQNLPIFITKGGHTKEFIYTIEVPKFYRVEKNTSGFQKVSFPYQTTSFEVNSSMGLVMNVNFGSLDVVRTGTIDQKIDDKSNKNKVTFSSIISLSNPFYSFEVSFIPSEIFLLLIISLLLIPILVDLKNFGKQEYGYKFLIECYGLIIILMGVTLFNSKEVFLFFEKALEFINPIFILFLLIFPLIYLILLKIRYRSFRINFFGLRLLLRL